MSDQKQYIALREINTTYPGTTDNAQKTSWTQGKSNSSNTITFRPAWDIPPRTQNTPLILINGIPLSDLPADTPAGNVWNPEEEEYVEFTRPVVHGTIKFRRDTDFFPGSSSASESSTGTTQDTPASTGTPSPKVPPGFTEGHRGQANLYDRPLHRIPSGYSRYGAQGIHQPDVGRAADPVTPRRGKTPTDVYSSASSYMSRNSSMLPPIRTTGLNPDANHFTPGASPMVSTTTNKEPPREPAAFLRLGQSGPLDRELDNIYLNNQAEIHRRSMRPAWGGQARVQVRTNETRVLVGQHSHESRQVIEDEREHIDAVNDWYWAQATQSAPAPKPELKK